MGFLNENVLSHGCENLSVVVTVIILYSFFVCFRSTVQMKMPVSPSYSWETKVARFPFRVIVVLAQYFRMFQQVHSNDDTMQNRLTKKKKLFVTLFRV